MAGEDVNVLEMKETDSVFVDLRVVLNAFIKRLQAPGEPKSRPRSVVVTKLEEAEMWASKASFEEG